MGKLSVLYKQVVSKASLYRSAQLAARGKRHTMSVSNFNFRLEEEIDCLHRELLSKSWRPGGYRTFTIYEPKERRISAAPFCDRVVHHAVHSFLEPIFESDFIFDSYACRTGKGTHRAVERAEGYIRKHRYCFHGDIAKYFYSIDRDIMKRLIALKVSDTDLLWLVNAIIDSAASLGGAAGLPIGNLTSQLFANIYLNELDGYVCYSMRPAGYIRYMDDFLIFSDSRRELCLAKNRIRDFLKESLHLNMHEGKSQIYNTGEGIKFLGFKIFSGYRRLTRENVRRFKERLKIFCRLLHERKMTLGKVIDSVRCWVAHSSYADTNGLRLSIFNKLAENDEHCGGLLKDALLPAAIPKTRLPARLHVNQCQAGGLRLRLAMTE